MFTSSPPSEVTDWFDDFHPPTFLRSGARATRTYTIPSGPILQHHSSPPEPFPHNEEPQLRKLGLHTKMVRGVPTLEREHVVCKQGQTLGTEQAQILKLVGIKMGEFRVRLRWRWDKESGDVVEIEGGDSDPQAEEEPGAEEDGEDEDEGMSE